MGWNRESNSVCYQRRCPVVASYSVDRPVGNHSHWSARLEGIPHPPTSPIAHQSRPSPDPFHPQNHTLCRPLKSRVGKRYLSACRNVTFYDGHVACAGCYCASIHHVSVAVLASNPRPQSMNLIGWFNSPHGSMHGSPSQTPIPVAVS